MLFSFELLRRITIYNLIYYLDMFEVKKTFVLSDV